MNKKFNANLDFSINFIPFVGIGFGYQKSNRDLGLIILLPFMDIQLTYNFK